jgi:hypothetical protein
LSDTSKESSVLNTRNVSARERNHTLVLEAGLYLLRYASTRAAGNPPFIQIQPADADVDTISFMPGPGAAHQRLREPGSYLLVQATRPGALELTVCAQRTNGSLDAEVRLEKIVTEQSAYKDAFIKADDADQIEASSPDVEVLAHVSHRGDAISKQGDWVCGPSMPMPIEGFEIRWPNRPVDVDLVYSVYSGRRNRQRSREAHAGHFVGTRGKSAPLMGLTLGLKGRRASEYELRCDALFLGSQVLSKRGTEVSLSGPTGQEPLVGFRLSIASRVKSYSAMQVTNPKSAKPSGRVRVYRPASVLTS